MEDLIGKRLKYKGTNDVKIVKDVKNNVVYFTDNGRIDLSKLNENFDEVPSQKINTETFFEPGATNFGNLLSQIEQLQNDPDGFARHSAQNNHHEEPITRVNGQDISGLSPETVQWMRQQEEDNKKRAQNKEQANKQDPWMQQFADGGGEVKRVESNYEEQLEHVQKVNSGEITPNTPINNQSTNMNTNSGNNGLPKMKKTFKVKLKFELSELIPKVEDIRAVENLFEVSLTESLAKEIADKYLNDRELFEGMIISELDKIIKPKKKKSVAKKPVAKKTTTKKNEV